METGGPFLSQHLFDAVQHFHAGLMALQLSQSTGVQVAEIHAGGKPLIQSTQLQHLVQIPQLVDLAHGFGAEGDMSKPGGVAGGHHFFQGFQGNILGLPPGALHQCTRVNNYPGGTHPVCRLAGRCDIADGLLQAVGIGIGQIDEIGSVEG